MRYIQIKKKNIDIKEFVKRSALESDYDTLITEPTTLIEDGKIKVIYDHLDFETRDIVNAVQSIKYSKSKRSNGLVTSSRIFGYRPRITMRQNFCSSTSLSREAPTQHQIVCDLGVRLEAIYKKNDPAGYAKHKAQTNKSIRKEWRMNESSIFTSGIINKNNPLKYHFDTGNFNDVYSMMVVFKGGVEGGHISLPEYGIAFKLPNNSIFMFDGQSILHGVTPIKYSSPMGYRFSIVYYSLKTMWQCLEINEELLRIRAKKTQSERTRMENPLTEEDRLLKEKNIKSIKAKKNE